MGESNVASATIKIFLVHGDPKRLRTAELSNWTGKAVAGPRSEFEGVISREEAEGSGIYFLSGSDPDSGKPALYIGEAECIRDRLKAHLQRDFCCRGTSGIMWLSLSAKMRILRSHISDILRASLLIKLEMQAGLT
jgi:hypothetical protein